jgi:hypothetical protein
MSRNSSISDDTWNQTQLQNHLAQNLDITIFLDEVIQTPYLTHQEYPLLNHDFLCNALNRSNYSSTADPRSFIDYLIRTVTSQGAVPDTIPLSKVACACIGLIEETATLEMRCSELLNTINLRAHYISGEEKRTKEEGILISNLFEFVTDKNILQKVSNSKRRCEQM